MVLFEVGGFESVLDDREVREGEKDDRTYTCLRCGSYITDVKSEIPVNGSFRHSRTNPHGIMFAIGCFSRAPGCISAGPVTDEFTWFPGFAWRVCGCGTCGFHLGWEFSKGDAVFFGLILKNLADS